MESFKIAEHRVVLRHCGRIDPTRIEDYLAHDGYAALKEALTQGSPTAVLQAIKASGLRGRGGAAFPTGVKWETAARTQAPERFVVCNADEGEPGTWKDRVLLEGDPHSIIEGMILCGYAIGARRGYFYIRGEYTHAIALMAQALEQARSLGFLGQNLLGSGFNFDVEIRTGAGAYVCGEETALLNSIEGGRGEPRLKPPYPAAAGLWGSPTVVNNVETLANVPVILTRGVEWFRSLGTQRCPGTKVLTLSGDVTRPGVYEVPMGAPLRQIIFDLAGGIANGSRFKVAQVGGASGALVAESQLDTPLDYDQMAALGLTLGAGAIMVLDERRCMVDVAAAWARFFHRESCGQCTPCREGTLQLVSILEGVAHGEATREHLELLAELADVMRWTSLCALGQTAPLAISQAIQLFADEFAAHIESRRCPAGVCRFPATLPVRG